jgi:bacterioferritin-associated ferredoxin
MISNLVLQDTINGIKNIGRCELTIVDLDGKVVASTEDENTIDRNDIVIFAQSQADSQEIRGSMYFKVYDDYQVEYVVIVTGGEDMSMIGKLSAFQIQNLVIAEKEHFTRKADKDFIATRRGVIHAANLSPEERAELIRKNPAYGMMVCRCEMISEGEIVDAIRRTLGARSMDGIKRRTRQGMGRCQAGFCTPRAMEILSRETGIPMEEICKNRKGSELIKG